MYKRVLQIHKIVDGRTPSYLRDKMSPNRRNLANLPCVFKDIKCRTDRYLNRFFPDAISVWNNIISNFDYLPTFGRLENHLISLIRPKSRSTFDLHDSLYLFFFLYKYKRLQFEPFWEQMIVNDPFLGVTVCQSSSPDSTTKNTDS